MGLPDLVPPTPDFARPKPPRDAKGRVLPGHSLNPGGRPEGASALARAILERARGWEYLEDIVAGVEQVAPEKRVEVIFRLIDRAHGKSVERVQAEVATVGAEVIPPENVPADVLQWLIRVETGPKDLPSTDPQTVEGTVTPQLPKG